MKKSLILIFLASLLSQTQALAIDNLDAFMDTLQAKGAWKGTGTTKIASGRNAGTYNIQVDLNVVKNQDNSWTMTSTIEGAPPKTTTSVATFQWYYDQDQNQYLQITNGQNISYADSVAVDPTLLNFTVNRTDPVTNAVISNTRKMQLNPTGTSLIVTVENLQNGNPAQTYTYTLVPVQP